jgi:hypothetical protein
MRRNGCKSGTTLVVILCSRSVHDRNVLVRRAQSRIDQATLPGEKQASLEEKKLKQA